MNGCNMELLLAAASADQEDPVVESSPHLEEQSDEETEWIGYQEDDETSEVVDFQDDVANDDNNFIEYQAYSDVEVFPIVVATFPIKFVPAWKWEILSPS